MDKFQVKMKQCGLKALGDSWGVLAFCEDYKLCWLHLKLSSMQLINGKLDSIRISFVSNRSGAAGWLIEIKACFVPKSQFSQLKHNVSESLHMMRGPGRYIDNTFIRSMGRPQHVERAFDPPLRPLPWFYTIM